MYTITVTVNEHTLRLTSLVYLIALLIGTSVFFHSYSISAQN